ncbi:11164_t:CDS:2 [Entrophospora sp. SA101]|nr:11164_t:CDS:2 [Entrophospora sp. SA101]
MFRKRACYNCGYNPLGWKNVNLGLGQGTKDSFIFTLGDGQSPYNAKIARIAPTSLVDKDVDDLAWHGPRFGKGPDLWLKMNRDQSGEARKVTYESSILENDGRFRWELYHILEPMYEATKLLSSSSYPTMGDVILAFIGMFTTLDHYLDAQLQ